MKKYKQNKLDRFKIISSKNLNNLKKFNRWSFNKLDIKVLNLSLPKSGTNMIEQILSAIPGLRMQFGKSLTYKGDKYINSYISRLKSLKNGTYLSAHLPFKTEIYDVINHHGIKCIVTIRDPRAVFCSLYNYLDSMDHTHPASKYMRTLNSKNEKINFLVNGYQGIAQPFDKILEEYMGWLNQASVKVIRFEDIVGPIGGGSLLERSKQLEDLFCFLDINNLNSKNFNALIDPTKSSTFRAPSIDSWKSFFSDEQMLFFNKRMKGLINEFGYQKI